jgi:hypothetical protein
MSDLQCACCSEPVERLRYFPRQLLTADDMRVEQEYFREKARRHNRYLHGWGVVCGCTVEAIAGSKTPQVRVCPGYVVDPQGDEICIDRCVDVDLKTGAAEQPCSVRWPCPPVGEVPVVNDGRATVYIAVRYASAALCGCTRPAAAATKPAANTRGCATPTRSRSCGNCPTHMSRRARTTMPGAPQSIRQSRNCSSACIIFRYHRARSAITIRG